MLINDSVTIAVEIPIYLTHDDLLYFKNHNFSLNPNDFSTPITGHIDLIQIRNNLIHVLDYKPEASKIHPIHQLTIYALALASKTKLPLTMFKCAWFDENNYYEFFPLHVVKNRKEEEAINKKRISNKKMCSKIMEDFNVGKGEAETIALCLENKLDIITDDKKAINACRVLKIKFTTIPNILVEMSREKIITKSQAETYAVKLERIGRYKKEIIEKIKEDIKNDKNE